MESASYFVGSSCSVTSEYLRTDIIFILENFTRKCCDLCERRGRKKLFICFLIIEDSALLAKEREASSVYYEDI